MTPALWTGGAEVAAVSFEKWKKRCHAEWHYPRSMRRRRGKRLLRLFDCACARRIWHLLPDERSREAVEVAERFADGLATEEERDEAALAAGRACAVLYAAHDVLRNDFTLNALDAPDESRCRADYDEAWRRFTADRATAADFPRYAICAASVAYAAISASLRNVAPYVAANATGWEKGASSHTSDEEAVEAQQRLSYDIYGLSPGLKPVTAAPWVAWNGGTVKRMAGVIYDEKTFDQMPVLGDALEDAGCKNAAVLTHCREETVHVRGCWLLDLLLGKD